ncbi:hypothetical protein N7486_007236 [Penicillium sp. IBT 16267x]|nr:hypothetical protein N7486_007236 [Penicillium sp. IBT 16267x]
MKYVVKADFPYEWYWQGKPLRKGYIRGEHIIPQPIGIAPRGAPRDSSPAIRPTCPRCGREYEQPGPPTPSSSGDTERNTVYLTPFCSCLIDELEPPPPVRRCTCNICRATTPATPIHHTIVPPTPALTRTVTPAPAPCHPEYPTGSPRMVYCLYCQEYHHVCQHTAVPIPGAQQPVETPVPTPRARPAQQPQARCQCPQCVAAAAAAAAAEVEAGNRHHVHRHLDGRRFENYVSPNVTDDTASVSSVDMGPRIDRGVEEVRNGHLVLTIPVEITE